MSENNSKKILLSSESSILKLPKQPCRAITLVPKQADKLDFWSKSLFFLIDILYGRNASCRALKDNFQDFVGGMYWIHPWRDARKIKVSCRKYGSNIHKKLRS